uniref:X8 domain-containing protein n=3 Tax=Oryza TaxID=4527 RepID=A0A0E0MZL5_ORYRU
MAYLGLLVLLLAFCGGAEHHGAEAAGDASARGASARRGLATVSVAKPSYPTVTTPMSASTSPSTMPMSSSPSAFPSLATAGGGGGGGGGGSWCVASQSASPTALQVALDYACGYGADCSAIQPGGSCFNPDTVHDHASYAFNSYYQKNPVATSCDFGGTATITNTDPSKLISVPTQQHLNPCGHNFLTSLLVFHPCRFRVVPVFSLERWWSEHAAPAVPDHPAAANPDDADADHPDDTNTDHAGHRDADLRWIHDPS